MLRWARLRGSSIRRPTQLLNTVNRNSNEPTQDLAGQDKRRRAASHTRLGNRQEIRNKPVLRKLALPKVDQLRTRAVMPAFRMAWLLVSNPASSRTRKTPGRHLVGRLATGTQVPDRSNPHRNKAMARAIRICTAIQVLVFIRADPEERAHPVVQPQGSHITQFLG